MQINDIPALNACLNALATVLIVSGIVSVKTGRKELHRKLMFAALVTSAIFLVGYVGHKIAVQGVHTPFNGTGGIRTFYLLMLASHIILAIAIVPLVGTTVMHAIKGRFEKHKKWARITYPIWLYVSVTGVLVYYFLYVWYPA